VTQKPGSLTPGFAVTQKPGSLTPGFAVTQKPGSFTWNSNLMLVMQKAWIKWSSWNLSFFLQIWRWLPKIPSWPLKFYFSGSRTLEWNWQVSTLSLPIRIGETKPTSSYKWLLKEAFGREEVPRAMSSWIWHRHKLIVLYQVQDSSFCVPLAAHNHTVYVCA
jgi:hypothetical protein